MFHITHQSDMDALHYVHTMSFQMFCYAEGVITHITVVWTLHINVNSM